MWVLCLFFNIWLATCFGLLHHNKDSSSLRNKIINLSLYRFCCNYVFTRSHCFQNADKQYRIIQIIKYEDSVLPGYDFVSLGNLFPSFRDKAVGSSSVGKIPKKSSYLTWHNLNIMLLRCLETSGLHLPSDAASWPGKRECSVTLLWRTKKSRD
jgi:hypothetical protein